MADHNPAPFAKASTKADLEQGTAFAPRFDADGLIPAIATDSKTGVVLMFAWMNREALLTSIRTREAHFWSRSRAKLWRKGDESGNFLTIEEMRTDCDQDVVLLKVRTAGRGVACHTGAQSCFYRTVALGEPTTGPILLARAKS